MHFKIVIGLCVALAGIPLHVFAGEEENRIIAEMVEAHGGEALMNLRSFVIEEKAVAYLFHGGRGPETAEPNFDSVRLAYDATRDAYSYEHWVYPEGGEPQHTLTLIENGEGVEFDFRNRDFSAIGSASIKGTVPIWLARQAFFLVRDISRNADLASRLADGDFRGRPQFVLLYDPDWYPPMTIYVDQETGLLTKMEWTSSAHEVGRTTTFYADYDVSGAIPFIRGWTNKAYGRTYAHTRSRLVRWDVPVDSFFEYPAGLSEVTREPVTELSVKEVADGIHIVGQGIDYTIFIDTAAELVGYGSRRGLRNRLEEYRRVTGNTLPLAKQIIHHHHSDHLWGLNELEGEATAFILARDHMLPLRDSYEGHLPDRRLVPVDERLTLDGARGIELYDISTIHTANLLVAYVPDAKLLLAADHYFTAGRTTPIAPYPSARGFAAAIEQLNLDIEQIATVHNFRLLTVQDIETTLAGQEGPKCFGNRPVCSTE